MTQRDNFSSKLGIIAAAAGSAIGLGNIWKFPYMAGHYGGSAFIFIYLIAILLMGYPLICSEFAIGRKTCTNAFDAYGNLTKHKSWCIVGAIAIITVFLVNTFYSMITGWVIYYFTTSFSGSLYQIAEGLPAATHFETVFKNMTSSFAIPFIFSAISVIITSFICSAGIKEGVEKYSKILMPLLFIIFAGLIMYSFTLEGFGEAVHFLFKPDFSQLTPHVIIAAIGQAFFSLSLGMGALITYGSYVDSKENLRSISFQVIIADTIIALFSGLLIFPVVFTYDLSPNAGPPLIFISLPQVFASMPGGRWFGSLFFLLITVAAITSMISMSEIVITFVHDKTPLTRKQVTWLMAVITLVGTAINILGEGALSFIRIIGDRSIFDSLDYLTNNLTIPLVGALTAIFVTWVWKSPELSKELSSNGLFVRNYDIFFNFLLKWIIPPAIFILMLTSLGIF